MIAEREALIFAILAARGIDYSFENADFSQPADDRRPQDRADFGN